MTSDKSIHFDWPQSGPPYNRKQSPYLNWSGKEKMTPCIYQSAWQMKFQMPVANIILKCSAREIIKKPLNGKNKVDSVKWVSSKERWAGWQCWFPHGWFHSQLLAIFQSDQARRSGERKREERVHCKDLSLGPCPEWQSDNSACPPWFALRPQCHFR